jgi:hypothetical protein
MRRYARIGILLILGVGTLAACATQPIPDAYQPPGFLFGFIHGLISPFALIAELFTDVRVYAFPNSGGWYDFGFMAGIFVWAGGSQAA